MKSSSLPDLSGQLIDKGRLLLLRSIGTGSFGRVYRALDTTSDPDDPDFYAVKCVSKTGLTRIRALHQTWELYLHHLVSGSPHVLSLHAVIEEELYLYLVLDLSSRDLFRAIKDGVYFCNDARIRQAFVEILDGVHACHQQGVYHRDLKPENILCRRNGTDILIADFGMATSERICWDLGCGSRSYMSPECLKRKDSSTPYSPLHTDIWSLGIILVNMVTGDCPWYMASPSDDRFSSFMDNPNFLRDVLPISQPLNELLKRILKYDPAARITISEMRKEILNMETFYITREELRLISAEEWTKEFSYDLVAYDSKYSDDFPRSNRSHDSAEHVAALRESTEAPSRCYESIIVNVGPSDCLGSCSNGSESDSCDLDPEGASPLIPETFAGGLAEVQDLNGILSKVMATLGLGPSSG